MQNKDTDKGFMSQDKNRQGGASRQSEQDKMRDKEFGEKGKGSEIGSQPDPNAKSERERADR